MANAIDNRFNQESFDEYAKMESLLVKCLNCQDYLKESHFVGAKHGEDVDQTIFNMPAMYTNTIPGMHRNKTFT